MSTNPTQLLEILAINVQSGKSKKTGNDFSLPKAQCIIRAADGKIEVGELILPKHLEATVVGVYDADYVLGVDMQGKVVPRITALRPFQVKPSAAAPAQNKAA
jgi:hypothetical protein